MRLIRIFTMAMFMSLAGFAVMPAQVAHAAPVAASSLGEQASPSSLKPTQVWYYVYRRHYRRHYYHRYYYHRYYHRHYYHHYYRRHYYW